MVAHEDSIATDFARSADALGRAASDRDLISAAEAIAAAMTCTLRAGGKILIAGNGGSAADSQHIATELLSRFARERRPLPAIALTDPAVLTAIGYNFARLLAWLRRLWRVLLRLALMLLVVTNSRRQAPTTAAA